MSESDPVLELYKLEYEKAADRYENVYQSIWTNFSYTSLVAGGILTFGSASFDVKETAVLLACFPLFFWYLATFLPLNRYGDQAAERLQEIEAIVNWKYKTRLNHFTKFSMRAAGGMKPLTSVRFALAIFFLLLFVVAVFLSYKIFILLGKWENFRVLGGVAALAEVFILAGILRGMRQAFRAKHAGLKVLLIDLNDYAAVEIINVEGLAERFKHLTEKVIKKVSLSAATAGGISVEEIDWDRLRVIVEDASVPGIKAVLVYKEFVIEPTTGAKENKGRLMVLGANELKAIHESVFPD
ncbi:MAG: hypothetical protein QOG71_1854 [Pyrinomonadaceae bacterium]|nr:hypothetical protein [Pyrinomonadaceae bacterium]